MYVIWLNVLVICVNVIVDVIELGLVINFDNVKWVECVFFEFEWNFFIYMVVFEYIYICFLCVIGKFLVFCVEYIDGCNFDVICKKLIVIVFVYFV